MASTLLRIGVGLALTALPACTNFHVLEEGRVYRSGQPDGQQLKTWIWRHDIETVLRLRGGGMERQEYRDSFLPTQAAGIDFVQVPLSAKRFPEKAALMRICDVFENAKYPLLIHCQAGADRTGLVSALYVLWSKGDLEAARGQLVLLPYGHLGWFGMDKADLVIDMYEPWHGTKGICAWVREVYEQPGGEVIPDGYLAAMRTRADDERTEMIAPAPR